MSSELERYKALCVAQEAEIARLQSGFDELLEHAKYNCTLPVLDQWSDAWVKSNKGFIHKINRITGVEN